MNNTHPRFTRLLPSEQAELAIIQLGNCVELLSETSIHVLERIVVVSESEGTVPISRALRLVETALNNIQARLGSTGSEVA